MRGPSCASPSEAQVFPSWLAFSSFHLDPERIVDDVCMFVARRRHACRDNHLKDRNMKKSFLSSRRPRFCIRHSYHRLRMRSFDRLSDAVATLENPRTLRPFLPMSVPWMIQHHLSESLDLRKSFARHSTKGFQTVWAMGRSGACGSSSNLRRGGRG